MEDGVVRRLKSAVTMVLILNAGGERRHSTDQAEPWLMQILDGVPRRPPFLDQTEP